MARAGKHNDELLLLKEFEVAGSLGQTELGETTEEHSAASQRLSTSSWLDDS